MWHEENIGPNFYSGFLECVLDYVKNGNAQVSHGCVFSVLKPHLGLGVTIKGGTLWYRGQHYFPTGSRFQARLWVLLCGVCKCCYITGFHQVHWLVGCWNCRSKTFFFFFGAVSVVWGS